MKYLIIFTFLSLSISSNAQYESIFGQNSTQWDFRWGNLFGNFQDTIYTQKDTVVNGVSWKKIVCGSCFHYYLGGLLREDTTLGKVWYKSLPDPNSSPDTSIQLIFDFSLQIGDSFDISGAWGGVNPPNIYSKVDSIYYKNGLKHIVFNHNGFSVPFFIEGVGCIAGITYKQEPTLMRDQQLLCVYKDSISSYDNPYHNCFVISNTLEINNNSIYKIYPNPFNNQIYIEHPDISSIKLVEIYNLQGSKVYTKTFLESPLMLDVPKGIYFLKITEKNKSSYLQKLIKK